MHTSVKHYEFHVIRKHRKPLIILCPISIKPNTLWTTDALGTTQQEQYLFHSFCIYNKTLGQYKYYVTTFIVNFLISTIGLRVFPSPFQKCLKIHFKYTENQMLRDKMSFHLRHEFILLTTTFVWPRNKLKSQPSVNRTCERKVPYKYRTKYDFC